MKARYISQLFDAPLVNRKTEEELTKLQMKIVEISSQSNNRPEPIDTRVKKSNFSEDNEESLNEQ